MKTKKLIKRLGAVLQTAAEGSEMQRAGLEKLLVRMAEKEAALAERLVGESDPDEVAKLGRKIALLQAQRRKGAELLTGLK